jgi:hypothetical protein
MGLLALFVGAQLASWGFARFHPGYRPEAMRPVAEHIMREFRGGDIIVVRDNDAGSFATLHYYLNSGDQIRPLFYFDEDGNPPPFWEGLGAMPKAAFVSDPDLLGAGQKRIWMPLHSPEDRPWDHLDTGRTTLEHWTNHYFRVLGGADPRPPEGEYGRVNLYAIPVEKEFNIDAIWPRWRAWIERYRKDQASSALGRFLRLQAPSKAAAESSEANE